MGLPSFRRVRRVENGREDRLSQEREGQTDELGQKTDLQLL